MSKASIRESCDEEKQVSIINREAHETENSVDQAVEKPFGVFGPLLSKLFKSGVEARGIERVPEHQREPKYFGTSALFMWCSANMVLRTIPVGALGQRAFSLTLPHVIATLLCFGILGCIATAFIATLGPQTGLRTMIISRYSSGYIGCKLYSVLNILTGFGFGTIAVIIGGQTLASINLNTLPLVVGIVIIGVCSLIPCFIGYNMVHAYEHYAWIVPFFIMCCLFGLGGKAGYDVNAQKPLEATGRELAANILSFGSVVFGLFSGWAPVAADYNCRLPVDTSPWRVFILTCLGLYIPVVFGFTLGATLMTITNTVYVAAFGAHGNTGALIAQVLSPWGGGGKFLLVLLAFSAVANNIPNMYSAAFSIQALGRPFAIVPRFVWVIFIFMIYTIAGIAGREYLSTIINSILCMTSYWNVFFVVIVAEEHFLFRRKGGRLGGYNLEDWDNCAELPVGIAGISACCCGIVGALVGISPTWYAGPVAKIAGATTGANIGFELAACFSAVIFPPLRWLEIHMTGR